MARNPLDYGTPGEAAAEEHALRHDDESAARQAAGMETEQIIAAFRGMDHTPEDPEGPGPENPDLEHRGWALTGLVQEGIREMADVRPASYRERYGSGGGERDDAVHNLTDALGAAGRDMMTDGLIRQDPQLVREGRELMGHAQRLEERLMESPHEADALAVAERSLVLDPERLDPVIAAQAEEMMEALGHGGWEGMGPRQEDYVRDRITLGFANQIHDNGLANNRDAVLDAWDRACELGDAAGRERVAHVGLALQDAAQQILDPRPEDGPMALARREMGRGAEGDGLRRLAEAQGGIRAVCGAIRHNLGNPGWETARSEQQAILGLAQAGLSAGGAEEWLRRQTRELEEELAGAEESGYGQLRERLGRKALELCAEAAESLALRTAQAEAPAWTGLSAAETSRLRAALIIRQYSAPGAIQKLVADEAARRREE